MKDETEARKVYAQKSRLMFSRDEYQGKANMIIRYDYDDLYRKSQNQWFVYQTKEGCRES